MSCYNICLAPKAQYINPNRAGNLLTVVHKDAMGSADQKKKKKIFFFRKWPNSRAQFANS